MQQLTVAVIGLGYFSRFHQDAWAGLDGVRIVGVTDLDPARVAEASARLGVPGFGDAAALLAATDPDIVDIVAPPPAHLDTIRLASRRGRIVICQKPFCRNLAEAEQATAVAEAAGADLAIHENFRFQPWYRTLKAFLDSGRMGRVWQCRFDLRPGDGRGAEAYMDLQPRFRTMPKLLIHETAVHFVDLYRWLFGPIETVYADLRHLNPVVMGEDAGTLILGHAGGARTVFDGNRLADHVSDSPRRTMGEMLLEGEGGALTLDGMGRLRFRPFGAAEAEDIPLIAPIDEATFGGGCVAALIAHVAAAARGQGALENRARDYLAVIRATEAAYVSHQTGARVAL